MIRNKYNLVRFGLTLFTGLVISSEVNAQSLEPLQSANPVLASTTVLRVTPPTPLITDKDRQPADEHPLARALRFASAHYDYILNNVDDYTGLLLRRERIDGQLRGYDYIKLKVREQRRLDGGGVVPFSVYLKFLKPSSVKGREVLFLRGHNDGDMLVRNGGKRLAFVNLWLDPTGDLAMRDNRNPVTSLGLENLVRQLIEVAEEDMKYSGECEVHFFDEARIDGRVCSAIEVVHPVRRDYFRFHIARIFVDKESHVPIRYSSYSWPAEVGGKPLLLEEYTYRNLKLNVGLTDNDFSRHHPDYGF